MMTYREFYETACALLPGDDDVAVQVEAWRYADGRQTCAWTIWSAQRSALYRGDTPEDALTCLRARIAHNARGTLPDANDTCEVA